MCQEPFRGNYGINLHGVLSMQSIVRQQIAYRCPECATATLGFLGGLRKASDMLRLRCGCNESALEIKPESEGKVRIDVPCVYCKDNHSYVVSADILLRDEPTCLPCPASHHDILFIASENDMHKELERSANELSVVMASFEADDVKDIQPSDVGEADAAPDPAIYDVLNFVMRDLEDAGALSCPCSKGPYSLRFTDCGAEIYCESCGASYEFHAKTGAMAESYLTVDKITLT